MPEDRMPKVLTQDIGDVDLPYLLYESDGPPLVLMHATGFPPWMWHPIARGLSPRWRVLAPYFCDHREFEPDEGGLSWFTLSEDLASFCKRLKLDSPALVGHSMGATVLTLATAACGLVARGLILIEPVFLPRDFYRMQVRLENHPLAVKAIKRKDGWRNRDEARSYLTSKPLFMNWEAEMLDLYITHGMKESDVGGLQLVCPPKREASLFMGGLKYDPWPFIPKVSCPALVIEGEASENRDFINQKKIAGLFSKGAYRMIKGAGHLIPMEKPGEILAIVNDFFAT